MNHDKIKIANLLKHKISIIVSVFRTQQANLGLSPYKCNLSRFFFQKTILHLVLEHAIVYSLIMLVIIHAIDFFVIRGIVLHDFVNDVQEIRSKWARKENDYNIDFLAYVAFLFSFSLFSFSTIKKISSIFKYQKLELWNISPITYIKL